MTEFLVRAEFVSLAQRIEAACRSGAFDETRSDLEDLAESLDRLNASHLELTFLVGLLSACAQCVTGDALEELIACRELVLQHWNGEVAPQHGSAMFSTPIWR